MILEARFLSWKKYLCEVLQMTLLFLVKYILTKYEKTYFWKHSPLQPLPYIDENLKLCYNSNETEIN